MILQIVKTFVDDDVADVDSWDVELTDDELATIEGIAKEGGALPCPSEGEEPLIFRGKTYDDEGLELEDLLNEIGKKITPDHVINIYVY